LQSKYEKYDGYDVTVGNAKIDQPMYTPKLLPMFVPEIDQSCTKHQLKKH
jgi:hypothetical protein